MKDQNRDEKNTLKVEKQERPTQTVVRKLEKHLGGHSGILQCCTHR